MPLEPRAWSSVLLGSSTGSVLSNGAMHIGCRELTRLLAGGRPPTSGSRAPSPGLHERGTRVGSILFPPVERSTANVPIDRSPSSRPARPSRRTSSDPHTSMRMATGHRRVGQSSRCAPGSSRTGCWWLAGWMTAAERRLTAIARPWSCTRGPRPRKHQTSDQRASRRGTPPTRTWLAGSKQKAGVCAQGNARCIPNDTRDFSRAAISSWPIPYSHARPASLAPARMGRHLPPPSRRSPAAVPGLAVSAVGSCWSVRAMLACTGPS